MPTDIDVTPPTDNWKVADINAFNKLPYYFGKMSAHSAMAFATWQKLYGTLPWKPKSGTTLRGVAQEPSPVVRQQFSPKQIDQLALKDVISTSERTSDAMVQRHKFESPQFAFQAEFQDFMSHLQFNNTDINRQIQIAQDMFIRTQALHKAPLMVVIGRESSELITVPYQTGVVDVDDAAGKTTAFWQDKISEIPNTGGSLDILAVNRLINYISEDVQATPFSKVHNVPKENQAVDDRYIMVGENSIYRNMIFDPESRALMSADSQYLTKPFSGSLFGRINFMTEQFPLRIASDGTFPTPQIINDTDKGGDSDEQVIPNPSYIEAPYAVAFITGADAYKALTVGAPPSEFGGSGMSRENFNKLNWNGRARLTANVLVNYAGNVKDTNKYGEVVQFIADATFGALAQTSRFCIPVLYRRNRHGAASS